MMNFSELILSFTVYSVLGWIVESIACSILARRFVSRGLLGGPVCTFYGFAAVVALAISGSVAHLIPLLTFVLCFVVLTLLKFATSWLLEKLFGIRLWYYGNKKLNIHGRVYWLNALALGLCGSAVVYLLQPGVLYLLSLIKPVELRMIASLLVGLYGLAAYRTLSMLARLNALLLAVRENGCEVPEEARKPSGKYQACFRLLNAYPRMQILGYEQELACLHAQWDTSHDTATKRIKALASAFGQKTMETVKNINPFAQGVSFHKLVWVFGIGCVLGYFIETAFCLINRGVLESRQGMLYGPFNQVYGIGAVLMVLFLQPLVKKGDGWVFVGSAIVGGAFEFVASWLQERVLGTVSWEYSDQAFSVGGRTSLLFMLFWGVLGVVFIKHIYPRLSDLIERIPKRQGTFFSWVIVITLSANMALSFAAVSRWIGRQKGVEARNSYEVFMDTHYPDAMMEEIYPSMMVVDDDGTRPKRTNL